MFEKHREDTAALEAQLKGMEELSRVNSDPDMLMAAAAIEELLEYRRSCGPTMQSLMDVNGKVAHSAKHWEEEALRYAANADFWRGKYENASWRSGNDELTGDTYQTLALTTEQTPLFINDAAGVPSKQLSTLVHALLGKVSEVGEMADALKKHFIYGKPLDFVNLEEEEGDSQWYSALWIKGIGSTFDKVWKQNIAKLKARFGDKFTQEKALNRDLDNERKVLEENR